MPNEERDQRILAARRAGQRRVDVAKAFGLSAPRIQQIETKDLHRRAQAALLSRYGRHVPLAVIAEVADALHRVRR